MTEFYNLKGERIFTPGPVELPDPVREVLGRQIIHHRTEEFKEAFLETRELFKRLVDDPSENFVFFASSGTGAMEASVQNFFKEGEKVIVVEGGKFGERWKELALRWGLEPVVLSLEWGESLRAEELEDLLKKHPDAVGVLLQISESSTGAYNEVREIKELLKDEDALLVADAITALGVYDIDPVEWGIDVLVGGSQKAFMLPPGLSMLWFSEKAKERLNDRAYYFSVKEELKKQKEGQTAFTPAIPLILALKVSLEMLLAVGTDKLEEKYRKMAQGTARALESLGFKLLPEKPVISLGAFLPPEGLSADELRKKLLSMGIRLAGGQGKLKGKIVRISYMGMDYLDLLQPIGALELALYEEGLLSAPKGEAVGLYLQSIAS